MPAVLTARCLACPWVGQTDAASNKHTKTTGHATVTTMKETKP